MNHLHIVSFNVPWPADYGGVIDVYYRIVALSKAGIKVHLHCYTYGREEAPELLQYCEEVCYYPREVGWRHQFGMKPYIIASRCSEALIERLKQDDYPILLEGLHNVFVLERLYMSGRKISIRAHNVEHDYYSALAAAEKWGKEKLFFKMEAWRLKRYESVLKKAHAILAISDADAAHFKSIGCKRVILTPPSHGHDRVTSLLGRGDYVLYHGNLSVAENILAVSNLAEHLFGCTPYQYVIAGRNPDERMQKLLTQFPNVKLVDNPSDEKMHRLIAEAQVNLLVTNQATGVKLKLMNALYEGRYCLVNPPMVAGTQLYDACIVADNPELLKSELARLMASDFSEIERSKREILLKHTDSINSYKNIIL